MAASSATGPGHRLSIVCAGDNIGVRDGLTIAELDTAKHSPFCTYTVAETLNGFVCVEVAPGVLVWYQNICSYTNNVFAAGRTLRNKQRGAWGSGWRERQQVFVDAPAYPKAHAVVNDVVDSIFGITMDDWAARAAAEEPPQPAVISATDRAFVQDRDAMYYKLNINDVSPELRDRYTLSFPPAHYSAMYAKLDGRPLRRAAGARGALALYFATHTAAIEAAAVAAGIPASSFYRSV
jgi:hypothetical protein